MLRRTAVADAADLAGFDDEAYDLVLALGPLYHILDPGRRGQAIEECLRVLRPGGHVFFAFLSVYAPICYQIRTDRWLLREREDLIKDILETGQHEARGKGAAFFTDACFVDPDEVADILAPYPLERITVFGAEGMVAQSLPQISALSGEALEAWKTFVLETAETKAALYASEHIVYVGRKPQR